MDPLNKLTIALLLLLLGGFPKLEALSEDAKNAKTEEQPSPEPYSFSYSSQADGGMSMHQESGDGSGRVTGFYTIMGDDGRERRVDYVADENGYRAVVKSNEIGTRGQSSADAQYQVELPSGGQLKAANVSFEQYRYLEDAHQPQKKIQARQTAALNSDSSRAYVGLKFRPDRDGRDKAADQVAASSQASAEALPPRLAASSQSSSSRDERFQQRKPDNAQQPLPVAERPDGKSRQSTKTILQQQPDRQIVQQALEIGTRDRSRRPDVSLPPVVPSRVIVSEDLTKQINEGFQMGQVAQSWLSGPQREEIQMWTKQAEQQQQLPESNSGEIIQEEQNNIIGELGDQMEDGMIVEAQRNNEADIPTVREPVKPEVPISSEAPNGTFFIGNLSESDKPLTVSSQSRTQGEPKLGQEVGQTEVDVGMEPQRPELGKRPISEGKIGSVNLPETRPQEAPRAESARPEGLKPSVQFMGMAMRPTTTTTTTTITTTTTTPRPETTASRVAETSTTTQPRAEIQRSTTQTSTTLLRITTRRPSTASEPSVPSRAPQQSREKVGSGPPPMSIVKKHKMNVAMKPTSAPITTGSPARSPLPAERKAVTEQRVTSAPVLDKWTASSVAVSAGVSQAQPQWSTGRPSGGPESGVSSMGLPSPQWQGSKTNARGASRRQFWKSDDQSRTRQPEPAATSGQAEGQQRASREAAADASWLRFGSRVASL